MANDRAFLYCPECNAHTLLFKTMADGWYPRGPEFLPQIEEWLDEHKACCWPWPEGCSAPPLHIRYECADPKLPADSRVGPDRVPERTPSEWNAALDAIVARFEDIDETAGWFVQDEARQMKRPEPPAPAWTREELEARAYEGRGDPEGAEQYAAKARAVQRIIDSGVRRVIDASVQRLIDQLRSEEPPPAPAWTREAPKAGPGFYWVRYDRHELLVAEFVVEAESSYWLTSGDLEEDPVDKYEHWPVRLEPPR